MKYYVIITEGRTDSSLIESILEKEFFFQQYQKKSDLPDFFKKMVGTYPVNGERLRFEGSPAFFHQNNDIGVAVKISRGISEIPDNIDGIMTIADGNEAFQGIIIVVDTDTNCNNKIMSNFIANCNNSGLDLSVDTSRNTITNSDGYEINFSLYNIPQTSHGAVEKLLLQCTKNIYPKLFAATEKFRDEIEQNTDFDVIRKECWSKKSNIQPFYADKMQFGFVVAILRPDKPPAMAVKDKLIRNKFLAQLKFVDEYNRLYKFLQKNLH